MVEIKFLPGVTDNISNTAKEIISDNLKGNFQHFNIGSTKILLIKGKKTEIQKISKKEANPLIQTIKIYSFKKYIEFFQKNKFELQEVRLPTKKYIKRDRRDAG